MITWLADATIRHRRPILLVGIALTTVEAWFTALARPTGTTLLVLLLAVLLFVALSAVRSGRIRTAGFVVRPDVVAFTAPPQPWPVYSALAISTLAGNGIGTFARNVRADDWLWLEAVNAGVYASAIVVFVTHAWKGYQLYLRPDGLYDRRAFGTLVVPWDAIRVAYPQVRPGRPTTIVIPPGAYAAGDTNPARERPGDLRLDYAYPDLVRRKGLPGKATRLNTAHVDIRFLAATINFYAQHPEHRAGVGTEDGYRRLQRALADGPQ